MTHPLPLRVLHVCSEPANEGSAPLMHSVAIVDGLRAYSDLEVSTQWRASGTTGRLSSLIRHQWRAFAAVRHADVVYARWHVLDLPLHVSTRLAGVPLVLEVNGRTDDLLISYPRLRGLRRLVEAVAAGSFHQAEHVITVSPGLQEWVRECATGVQVTWVSNGASADLQDQAREPVDPPRVLFVGQLASWQGIDVLLAAVRSAQWPKNCEVHVVGSGPDEPAAVAAAASGLVRHHGRLPREQAMQLLASARVSVSPQRTTFPRNLVMGLPFKVMESIMLGVPCVGSAIPQQQELLQSAPGCESYPHDDPDQLAAAVAQALSRSGATRTALRAYGLANTTWTGAITHAYKTLVVASARRRP